MILFFPRGIVEPEQIFPYPDVLDADRKETLSMLVSNAVLRVCDIVRIKIRIFKTYWVTQKLPHICTVILRIFIGKVA